MTDSDLIYQRDGSILVTLGDRRDELLRLVGQIGQLRSIVAGNHLYEFSPSALWGAAARGVTASQIIEALDRVGTMPVPVSLAARIAETLGRYGALEIVDRGRGPVLVARDDSILEDLGISGRRNGTGTVDLESSDVATIKLHAVRAGWPIVDRRHVSGDSATIRLNQHVRLRPYQAQALDAFENGRDGVILLPCGAGKTLVGVAVTAATGGPVLVLVPSRTVGEQWRSTLLDVTNLEPTDIAWVGESRRDEMVSLVTYHGATVGRAAGELAGRHWRLVIYDEVQSLPANVFRLAALIAAERRLGLSATLVREDGREAEVFALVGPPLYEASWLELERDGWIAPARCVEVRVPAAESDVVASRYKMAVVQRLLDMHHDGPVIVVGTGVRNLLQTGRRLGFPVLTGSSTSQRRAELFDDFRSEEVRVLGLSRIGSVGIDLPDASVLIQLSGTFGSRQEEAQRLGRILRPSDGKTARFYTIVAAGTREQHFAARRQRFLVNQGYEYEIVDAAALPRGTSERQ